MKELIKNEIINKWSKKLLGEPNKIEVEILQDSKKQSINKENIQLPISILIANISAAISTRKDLGTATESTLKEVKSRMDTKAGYAYAEALNFNDVANYVATSEGKDEYGEKVEDPLKNIETVSGDGFGIAVDVIDGTTLAARGLNGAYTLSAVSKDLKKFPDLQAYALACPKAVIEKFNFFNEPEQEITTLVKNLSEYYEKPISDLKIVTSSYDKGLGHQTLIDNMRKLGAQVIIPNPVIVEPPYIINMGLHLKDGVDAVIGVLGLPEMVINTLLLSTIKTDCELRFRIASNTLLDNRDKKKLDDIFKFKPEEKDEIKKLNLNTEELYSKETITSDIDSTCFCATALTDDDILNLNGIKINGSTIKLETLLSGICGYTLKISTTHFLD